MDRDDEDARRLLAPLRGVEPDVSGRVDVAEAVRSGRRRVRNRRMAGVASTTVVVVAIAVASTLLGRTIPPDRPQPIAPPGQFDVTRQFFRVGSAGGFTPDSYETGRYRQRVLLRLADPNTSRRADGVVMMFPRDRLAGRDGRPWTAPPTGAPSVNDRPAYWLDTPVIRAGAVELAWEWAPGAWAFASLKGDGVDRTLAHRVAQSVLPDGDRAVRAAVTAPASLLGAGNRLIGTVTSATTAGTRPMTALRYGPQDPPAQVPVAEPGWVAVGVERPASGRTYRATVGGRPAAVDRTRVAVREDSDTAFFAEVSDAGFLRSFGGQTRLRDLAAAVTKAPEVPWPPPQSASPSRSPG